MNSKITHPNFTVADDDIIDNYDDIAYEFFESILNMDYDECLVTDESSLSDFSSCGLPDNDKEYDSLQKLYDDWKVFILSKINNTYNIELDNTHILLIHLFEMIKQSKTKH